MTNALHVSNLSCRYNGQAVLDDLSFDVNKGEIVCLLGASGCGKTTLLKVIAGLLPLENGKIAINGRLIVGDNLNMPPEERKIGMIFQDYALFPHLTVTENIAFGLKNAEKSEMLGRVDTMLALVRLEGLGARYPYQLSGGQQQRVAIARALAYEPDLLLLDEPFSNIDTQVRHNLIQEIRNIFKQQGVTAIFVTHSHEEAFAFADKLAVMNEGRIEQYGNASDLYYQPSSRFVAEFLGHKADVPVRVTEVHELDTPFGTRELTTHVDSGEYDWFIRPQHLSMEANEEGEASVIEAHFMGDSSRYWVMYHSQKLLVYSTQLFHVGEKVTIHIQPHVPILFPATSIEKTVR